MHTARSNAASSENVGQNVFEVGSEDPNRGRLPAHEQRRDLPSRELLLTHDVPVHGLNEPIVDVGDAQLPNETAESLERLATQHFTGAAQEFRELQAPSAPQRLDLSQTRRSLGQLVERLDHRPEDRILAPQVERDSMSTTDLLQLVEVSVEATVDSLPTALELGPTAPVRRLAVAKQSAAEHGNPLLSVRSIHFEGLADIDEERGVVFEDLVANQTQNPCDLGEALGVTLEQLTQRRTPIVSPDPPRRHRDRQEQQDAGERVEQAE